VLCDFGLSRVKADVTSRTAKVAGGSIVGSRCWMAPERLQGGSLKKPCDIYAFAMTLYEVGTRYSWIENHGSDQTHLKDLHE
jgi:serine/threonine protein kinase